jgi:hypothetical protein
MSGFAAGLVNNLLHKKSPFVNQVELGKLIRRDRIEIDKELRLQEQIQRRPLRGVSPAPHKVIKDWRDYVEWIDVILTYLEQPRSVVELEKVVREWQDHRREIIPMTWQWKKRADVIPTA